MASSLVPYRSVLVFVLVSLLSFHVHAQSCNTNQNPHCAGNSQFAQLCCPYPAVCYYANRYGAVACCQAGQVCQGTGVLITVAPTTQITQIVQTTQTTQATQATQTIQTTYTTQTAQPTVTTQNTGYSTVTVVSGVAATTTIATAGTAVVSVVATLPTVATTAAVSVGYTTTAGVIIANGAIGTWGLQHAPPVAVGLAILTWIMT